MLSSTEFRQINVLVKLYLAIYNSVSCYFWGVCLFITFKHVQISRSPTQDYWAEVEFPLKLIQTAACLEILHAKEILGFVESGVVTTTLQGKYSFWLDWQFHLPSLICNYLFLPFSLVFSRIWVLWAVLAVSPESRVSVFTFLCIGSWSLVEVPRYAFYALNLFNAVPYPLFWLRYR